MTRESGTVYRKEIYNKGKGGSIQERLERGCSYTGEIYNKGKGAVYRRGL